MSDDDGGLWISGVGEHSMQLRGKLLCCINIFIPASGLPEWVTHTNAETERKVDVHEEDCQLTSLWGIPRLLNLSWSDKDRVERNKEGKNGLREAQKGQIERTEEGDVYDDWSWLLEKVVMVLMEHSQDKNHHDCYSVIIYSHAWHPEPVWFSFWNTKGDILLNFLAVLVHTVVEWGLVKLSSKHIKSGLMLVDTFIAPR